MAGLSVMQIRQMKSQGLTNNQIIQTFTKEGYSSKQIFDALNQEAIQPATPMAPSLLAAATPQPLNKGFSSNQGMPGPLPPPPGAGMIGPSPMGMQSMGTGPSDEELIEAIIDEKWNDLLGDINKIVAWKEKTAQQIAAIEQSMKDLKEQFEKLHAAVVGKVGEYDQHILQVGAEVKAMERVFSKVLPVFTDNVAELSRVADTMRGQGTQQSAPQSPATTKKSSK